VTVPAGAGEGVYFSCRVEHVKDDAAAFRARTLLAARGGMTPPTLSGPAAQVWTYQATPDRIWMNDIAVDDAGEYRYDVRVELPINVLTDLAPFHDHSQRHDHQRYENGLGRARDAAPGTGPSQCDRTV